MVRLSQLPAVAASGLLAIIRNPELGIGQEQRQMIHAHTLYLSSARQFETLLTLCCCITFFESGLLPACFFATRVSVVAGGKSCAQSKILLLKSLFMSIQSSSPLGPVGSFLPFACHLFACQAASLRSSPEALLSPVLKSCVFILHLLR